MVLVKEDKGGRPLSVEKQKEEKQRLARRLKIQNDAAKEVLASHLPTLMDVAIKEAKGGEEKKVGGVIFYRAPNASLLTNLLNMAFKAEEDGIDDQDKPISKLLKELRANQLSITYNDNRTLEVNSTEHS